MTQPRSEQVDEETTRYYHCIARCVRRAFLCGDDAYTGSNFDHRRGWIVERLKLLTSVFAIDVVAYAVMANHLHLVVRLSSDEAALWSAHEVVERFGKLYPMAKANYEKQDLAQQAETGKIWRERLGSLSWMMGNLNEWVARRANKEDDCTGRFWEGRFKSQPLLDEPALFTCMAYVDLNSVRAGECSRLEDAEWTSIGERLREAAQSTDESSAAPAGLVPFMDQCARQPATSTASALIEMNFVHYVALLEWTGRCGRQRGPSGTLSGSPPDVLARLRVKPGGWLAAMTPHGLQTRGALGRVGRQRVTGRGQAAALFG